MWYARDGERERERASKNEKLARERERVREISNRAGEQEQLVRNTVQTSDEWRGRGVARNTVIFTVRILRKVFCSP